MLRKFFDKYKKYIYLVCIAILIFMLATENSIVEGARSSNNVECDMNACNKKCPDKDISCLQQYAECGNCKYNVSQLTNTKQNNTLNMFKIQGNKIYEDSDDKADIGTLVPKLGIIPSQGPGVIDPNKDIMYNNDKLNRSYLFFPVRKSTTGMFQETGPSASNV